MERRSRRQSLQGSLALAGFGVLAGCGLQPTVSKQPAKVHHLGFLSSNLTNPEDDFQQGLRELGYLEGENILIEWRYAEGRNDRVPELAAELVALAPDVIIAVTGNDARAARQATSSIPIVFTVVNDPVGQGLVDSLARPGGNVTGMSTLSGVLAGKRLELLKEAFPTISRVAVLWNAFQSGQAPVFQQTQEAADRLGLQLISLGLRGREDVESALRTAIQQRADALAELPNTTTPLAWYPTQFVDFAIQHRLPAIYSIRSNVEAGGLMALEPDYPYNRRRTAWYVDKILKGARPADLPVEQPKTFYFGVNLKTAQALGMTIPPSVLAQATEVIQ